MSDSKENKISENLKNESTKIMDNITGKNIDHSQKSEKSWMVTLILAIFLGYIGIHRFYVGKIGTGILWLFTGGCFGIGWLIDIIMIVCGNFTDKERKPIKN